MNRGPGTRPDGSYYEAPGVSFLTLDNQAKICRQFDMFDLAHQMHLCDELETHGLLSADTGPGYALTGALNSLREAADALKLLITSNKSLALPNAPERV